MLTFLAATYAALLAPPLNRRAVSLAAAALVTKSALPASASFRQGGQIQGLGQFVKRLNDGARARDVQSVQVALELLKLPADTGSAMAAIEGIALDSGAASGDAGILRPFIDTSSITPGLTSTKLTARVEGPSQTNERYVKLMWLKDADTNKVICAKEFTSLKERTEMKLATVPKGIQAVVPCAYWVPNGIWYGEPISIDR